MKALIVSNDSFLIWEFLRRYDSVNLYDELMRDYGDALSAFGPEKVYVQNEAGSLEGLPPAPVCRVEVSDLCALAVALRHGLLLIPKEQLDSDLLLVGADYDCLLTF